MFVIFEQMLSIALCLLKSYLIFVLVVVLWKVCGCLKNHGLSKIWKVNLKAKYGSWAVITGCTDGIGKAYSYELAKRGINLILISRSTSKLEAVSSDIRRQFGVETEIVQFDFKQGFEKGYKDLEGFLKKRIIGILVNNVGVNIGISKPFYDVAQEIIGANINVNMAAPTYLTSLILPSMIKNGKGAIINISSLTAMNPSPFIGIYAASKVYNYFFSESLKYELRNKGIFVQTVTPGFVVTNMVTHLSPGFLSPTPEKYAEEAVSTIGYTTTTCGYYGHELFSIPFYILPQWLMVKVSLGWRRSSNPLYKERSY